MANTTGFFHIFATRDGLDWNWTGNPNQSTSLQIVLGTESLAVQRKLGARHQIGELEAEKQTKTERKSSAEQKNAGDSSSSWRQRETAENNRRNK